MNDKIKNLINLVYGESFSEAHRETLSGKISRAAAVITEKRKAGWDEKDIVLITYADQFYNKGRKRCLYLPVL